MKKIISIVLFSASLVTAYHTPTHANVDLASNLQIEQLFHQARLLASHGASHEEILNIFEQNLAQEILSASRPNASQRLLLASIICIACLGIGAGTTYYFMNKKLTAKNAEITQLNTNGHQQAALIQQLRADIAHLNQRPAQQQQQQQRPATEDAPQHMNIGNLLHQLGVNSANPGQSTNAADEFMQQIHGNHTTQRPEGIERILQELEQVGGNPFAGIPI